MIEALYLVIGLMIVMAAIPVVASLSLILAICKRFVMRFNDPMELHRFRVRLGGNVAYFVATLNGLVVVYYYVSAGLPMGTRFEPWIYAAAQRLPEGWYLATALAFLFGGFVLKVTRSPYVGLVVILLFVAQIAIELAPTAFELARDPGLFARFIAEIDRMHEAYANVGGIPGTVMATILAGLVYGVAMQAAYYALVLTSLLIALRATFSLRNLGGSRFEAGEI
ncbi:MAG TPA: hypothetical protein VGC25_12210 [Alphaproteobacteria bacterium]|jgi:hypothetical protein